MASGEMIPSQLETALRKMNILKNLSDEPEIQNEIVQLSSQWDNVRKQLNDLLNNEGYTVVMRKSKLLSKIRPDDITLDKFKIAVIRFRKGLGEWADTVRKAQVQSHSVVTTCQVEKKKRENEINLICIDILNQRATIKNFESEIRNCTIEASSCDNDACQLETYNAQSYKRFKKHVKMAGFGSGLAVIVGSACAPFTEGFSLVGAAVYVWVNSAVIWTEAYVNESNAKTCKKNADKKRQDALHLRQKVNNINSDILRKESEVSEMKNREVQLEGTITAICEVEGLVNNLIEEVEERLINVQDVETMLHETELTGNSLSIILRAWERDRKKGVIRKLFGRRPRSLDPDAERLKNKIQGGAATDAVYMVGLFRMLRFSQLEVGKFLEICYIQLKEHPVEAGKVRETANEARMQHGMCSGLMKHFMTTAEFVTSDMMPMLKTVIKKRKSKIIRDMLEQILQNAEDMKKEAENVKDRYVALTAKLQQNITDVNTRNADVTEQKNQLTIERQEAESMEKQSEEELREIEEERRQILNEIQKMKQRRDEFFANAVPSETDDETWKNIMSMAVPSLLTPYDIVGAGIQAAKMPLHLVREGMKAYTAFKGGEKTQKAIEVEDEKQSKMREQIRESKETSLKRLAQIKRTDLKIATMGDVKGLMEALKLLSQVDKMFNEIILFWDNLSVFLKSLHKKTGAGKSFLKALKTKKYARMFEDTISKAEADWGKFGAICREYAMQTDQDTRMVYGFLSTPVDLMDDPERQSRICELTCDIEQNMLQLEL